MTFEERNAIEPAAVVRLMQQAPREYPAGRAAAIARRARLPAEEARFEFGAGLMKRLAARSR